MKYQSVRILTALLFTAGLCACAGPSSPFGAIELGSGDGFIAKIFGPRDASPDEVQYAPKRQMLHKSSDLEVTLNTMVTNSDRRLSSVSESSDEFENSVEFKVVYNGRDVTHAFAKNVQFNEDKTKDTLFSYKNLRLSPTKNHDIDFYFRENKTGTFVKSKFLPPYCAMGGVRSIASIEPFAPEDNILKIVKQQSYRYHVNPNFMAGLIAQESGFDIGVVSSAKAVGLTQVTPLAVDEISKIRPRWKTDLRLRENRPAVIKEMIEEKEVTAVDDWRLHPERSVEGGILYLLYLGQYWSLPENAELLRSQKNVDFNHVILASYNSGASRVKKQLQDNSDQWIEQSNLKEAKKYVNSISSYCYHFSGGVE
jgi:Transglycosylase SLT domain